MTVPPLTRSAVSEKRQGTKSRDSRLCGCGWLYGDCCVAMPVGVIPRRCSRDPGHLVMRWI